MENLEQTTTTFLKWEDLSFWQKVKNFFRGRIGRKHYFFSTVYFVLAVILAAFFLVFITDLVPLVFLIVAFILFGLITFAFSLSIAIRRLHDMDISALWLIPLYILPSLADLIGDDALIFCVAVLTLVAALCMIFRSGTKGTNRFGPPNSHKSFMDALLNSGTESAEEDTPTAAQSRKLDRKYRKPYFAAALICVVGITYSFHKHLENYTPVSYEEFPQGFVFILFPSVPEVQIYADKEFKERMGTSDRAFMVSGDELKIGIVETNIKTDGGCGIGYIKLSELTLVPPANTDELIEQTNDLYRECDLDTRLAWSAKPLDDDQYEVEYIDFFSTITEDDSSSIHRYTTRGNDLVKVLPSEDSGVIKTIIQLVFRIPIFLILMGLAWIVSRFIFVRKVVTGN